MSQYYPQQGPMYPPERNPEEYYDEGDYLEEEDSPTSPLQLGLAFAGGGCLVFVCISICAVVLGFLWILDPGAGAASAPVEGNEAGLSFDEPAFPDEPVTNEEGMQLTLLEVNRNASLESVPDAEGREVIIITVELVNFGEDEGSFNERNFLLVNALQEAYEPVVGAVAGSLGRGTLPPSEGLEGRLVFEVIEGEFELRLRWDPGNRAEPRYIYLE